MTIAGDKWLEAALKEPLPAGCTVRKEMDAERRTQFIDIHCPTFEIGFKSESVRWLADLVDKFALPYLNGALDLATDEKIRKAFAGAQEAFTLRIKPRPDVCGFLAAEPSWAKLATAFASRARGVMMVDGGRFYGPDGLGYVPLMGEGGIRPRLEEYRTTEWKQREKDCRPSAPPTR